MKGLWNWLTPKTSGREKADTTGKEALFSREAFSPEDFQANGLRRPNSKAAERVRRFLVEERAGANLREIAEEEGWKVRRFYAESQGESSLSWDFVDKIGGRLPLGERIALARFLMNRWGLRAEVGAVQSLED